MAFRKAREKLANTARRAQRWWRDEQVAKAQRESERENPPFRSETFAALLRGVNSAKAFPHLEQLLDSDNVFTRRRAMEALTQSTRAGAKHVLAKAATSNHNWEVRAQAIQALSHTRDSRWLSLYEHGLEGISDRVKAHCINAIAQLPGPRPLEALTGHWEHLGLESKPAARRHIEHARDPHVVVALASALTRFQYMHVNTELRGLLNAHVHRLTTQTPYAQNPRVQTMIRVLKHLQTPNGRLTENERVVRAALRAALTPHHAKSLQTQKGIRLLIRQLRDRHAALKVG